MALEVNPERGEVAVELGGAEYPMRPSYEAIVAIEEKTGMTLAQLCFAVQDSRRVAPLRILAIIVTEGIHAAAIDRKDSLLRHVKVETVGRHIFADYFNVLEKVSDFLTNALTGGVSADAKKKESPPILPTD